MTAAAACGADAPSGPACAGFDEGTSAGNVIAAAIDEASGIAASRVNPGVLWVHNDAGDEARLYALNAEGTLLATFALTGVAAGDWEDLAIGPGPDPARSYIYVGDIGDNELTRPQVAVHRVAEPKVDPAARDVSASLSDVTTFALSYPDTPNNAESVLVDPSDGAVYLLTKHEDGRSTMLRVAGDPPATLEPIVTLAFGAGALGGGGRLVTGGDIAPDGKELVIRTRGAAFVWRREAGEPWSDVLATDPCRVALRSEPQGEAVAYAADGSGLYTISEGRNQPVYFYARR